jgi:hypothetical protein
MASETATVVESESPACNDFDSAKTTAYQGDVRQSRHFIVNLMHCQSHKFILTARTEVGRAFMQRHFGHVGSSVELPKTFAVACINTMCKEGCLDGVE